MSDKQIEKAALRGHASVKLRIICAAMLLLAGCARKTWQQCVVEHASEIKAEESAILERSLREGWTYDEYSDAVLDVANSYCSGYPIETK